MIEKYFSTYLLKQFIKACGEISEHGYGQVIIMFDKGKVSHLIEAKSYKEKDCQVMDPQGYMKVKSRER